MKIQADFQIYTSEPLIIMVTIQPYCTLSNKNNGAELMFLFNIGL